MRPSPPDAPSPNTNDAAPAVAAPDVEVDADPGGVDPARFTAYFDGERGGEAARLLAADRHAEARVAFLELAKSLPTSSVLRVRAEFSAALSAHLSGEHAAALEELSSFLMIDIDLIAAASEKSAPLVDESISKEEVERWIEGLSVERKNALLLRLLDGEGPHLGAEVRRSMERELRPPSKLGSEERPRTVNELHKRAKELTVQRKRKEAERAERERAKRERARAAARKKHLDGLEGREDELKRRIRELIESKQPKKYDLAVEHLVDLLDLAVRDNSQLEFSKWMRGLREKHAKKNTLIQRFDEAKLP